MQLFPSNLVEIAGGKETVLALVKHFYDMSFRDPILGVLYDDKTLPHHELFCRWFFHSVGVDKVGPSLRRVNASHKKAQHCPLRVNAPNEAGFRGDGFTWHQRNRWLLMQIKACEDFNMPVQFVRPYIHGLCAFMGVYGPYTEARPGEGGKCPMRALQSDTTVSAPSPIIKPKDSRSSVDYAVAH
ncbi:hypothetical protein FOL47_010870 [Perkinsus chesapeaki]|uniref:Uncharacterized protein n=1 Tax=Perkinsus chesapeaki TaxID=330153 RepID=A0A7J6MNL9_PERCH|nr:hypothetical protein FOL47_010870 [Perkinsus chesapeaki]